MKVFECKSFIHMPKEHKLKQDDKAIKCIFFGYRHEEFDYKFWILEMKNVIKSSFVVFHKGQIVNQ